MGERVIKNVYIFRHKNNEERVFVGEVVKHPDFEVGTHIISSKVISIDKIGNKIQTIRGHTYDVLNFYNDEEVIERLEQLKEPKRSIYKEYFRLN